MSCKKPCKECPFLKNSVPGWLGEASYQPQVFLDSMEYNIIPCHMQVKWHEIEGKNLIVEGEQNPCVGALQFCVNSCKLPRGARSDNPYSNLLDKAKSNSEVFKWSADFIKHHSKTKRSGR